MIYVRKLTLREYLESVLSGDWTDKTRFPTMQIHSHDVCVGRQSKCCVHDREGLLLQSLLLSFISRSYNI